jgi:hypothetical protein
VKKLVARNVWAISNNPKLLQQSFLRIWDIEDPETEKAKIINGSILSKNTEHKTGLVFI